MVDPEKSAAVFQLTFFFFSVLDFPSHSRIQFPNQLHQAILWYKLINKHLYNQLLITAEGGMAMCRVWEEQLCWDFTIA